MSEVAPPPSANRILGLDLARALAIFGMLTVNFRAVLTETEEPAWLLRVAEQVDGRAAALFVFLAGFGISLLTRRSRESGDAAALRSDRWLLWRRALFLFVVGLAFRQVWEFDILHFYGVYLFAAAFLIAAPSRWLLALAGLLGLVFPILYYVLPSRFGIPFWGTNSGLMPGDLAIDIFFQGYHPFAPWFAFLLLGLGGLKLAFGLAPIATVELAADSFGTDPYPPMPLYVVAGAGWALAVTMLCLAVARRWGTRAWLTPLIHAGQLALSVYVFHGTVGAWAPGWLGYEPPLSLAWVLVYCAVFYAVTVMLATLWRRFFARGPLESIMRWLTGRRRWRSAAPAQ